MGPLGPTAAPCLPKGGPAEACCASSSPARAFLSLRPGLLVSLPPPLRPPQPSAVLASARALLRPLVLVLTQGPTSDHLPLLKLPRALYLPDTSWASQASAALGPRTPALPPVQNGQSVFPQGCQQSPAVSVGLPRLLRRVRSTRGGPCFLQTGPGPHLPPLSRWPLWPWWVTGLAVLTHTDLFPPQDLDLSASVPLAEASAGLYPSFPDCCVPGGGRFSPGFRRAWGTAGALLPADPPAVLPWRSSRGCCSLEPGHLVSGAAPGTAPPTVLCIW